MYDKLVWIRLYNLPIEYWGDISLEKIGHSLGTLLEIDEGIVEKDLYIYTRLKIVAVKEVPSHITLISSEGKWIQQVEVEKEITVYNQCGSKFHFERECRLFVRRAKRRFSQKAKSKQFWVEKNKPLQNVLCLPSTSRSGKEVIGKTSSNCTDSKKEVSTVQNSERMVENRVMVWTTSILDVSTNLLMSFWAEPREVGAEEASNKSEKEAQKKALLVYWTS
ncbi:hypothetical protein SUGI_0953500 [Cryptomeria japonica]|nr:hypothetical protein SUGI_0953500 [Cryptomeria japonica]